MTSELSGDRIRTLRKAKSLTLAALARNCGSSKSYLSELENNRHSRPSGDILVRIARALDVTPDAILGFDIEGSSPEDKAFILRYKALDQDAKSRIREIVNIIIR